MGGGDQHCQLWLSTIKGIVRGLIGGGCFCQDLRGVFPLYNGDIGQLEERLWESADQLRGNSNLSASGPSTDSICLSWTVTDRRRGLTLRVLFFTLIVGYLSYNIKCKSLGT